MADESENQRKTYGEKAVGFNFNPSGDPAVAHVKRQFADIIDDLNDLRTGRDESEVKRMCSIAITELQSAQMWAVKALTWED